jgi:hypothetical protein
MVFLGQLPVSLLDFLWRGLAVYSQNLVIVFCHSLILPGVRNLFSYSHYKESAAFVKALGRITFSFY